MIHNKHVRIIIAVLVFVIFISVINRGTGHILEKASICSECNVIIIGVDALQAAHVSHLGNKNETTPTIDALAKKGTSFSQAISPAPWTVPAFMSIFTGLYPSEHKVVNKFSIFTEEKQVISNLKELSPNVQTLADIFKANGYATAGFTGDAGVSAQFGYNKGFDAYTDEKTFGSIENSSAHALPWIEENKDNKFFIFLHGYDDHGQFDVPEKYKGRFMPANYAGPYKGTKEEQRNLREKGLSDGKINLTPDDVAFWRGWYDSKIRDADDRLAGFLEAYGRLGIKNKTIFVVVSDHGTEFYEHKRFDHGFSLYDELVRVPLVFVVPGLSGKGIISDQVTTLDVAPTLIDITGINVTETYRSQLRGKSLLSYLTTGKGEARDVFMETDYRNYTYKRGVRTADGWKYIMTMETGTEELYNVKSDPAETKNVLNEYPEISSRLNERVIRHIVETGQSPSGPWETGCVPVYGDQCK
ncbi:MAG: sulfatase [Patescibacteria group bacterium]